LQKGNVKSSLHKTKDVAKIQQVANLFVCNQSLVDAQVGEQTYQAYDSRDRQVGEQAALKEVHALAAQIARLWPYAILGCLYK
jgi:hypothetical protein